MAAASLPGTLAAGPPAHGTRGAGTGPRPRRHGASFPVPRPSRRRAGATPRDPPAAAGARAPLIPALPWQPPPAPEASPQRGEDPRAPRAASRPPHGGYNLKPRRISLARSSVADMVLPRRGRADGAGPGLAGARR